MNHREWVAGVLFALLWVVWIVDFSRTQRDARAAIAKTPLDDRIDVQRAVLSRFRTSAALVVAAAILLLGLAYFDSPRFMPNGVKGLSILFLVNALARLIPLPAWQERLYGRLILGSMAVDD